MPTSTRVSERLGVRHPIIQGPFGNGLSSVDLVAAVNRAGGLGSFGLAGFTADGIVDVAKKIRALTDGPFALNIWVPLAGEEETRLDPRAFERALQRLAPLYADVGVRLPTLEDIEKSRPPSFAEQSRALLEVRPPIA